MDTEIGSSPHVREHPFCALFNIFKRFIPARAGTFGYAKYDSLAERFIPHVREH